MHLHAAHAHAARLGARADEIHFVAGSERAREHGSGDHGAESFDRKRSIEREKERPQLGARRGLPGPHRLGDGPDQIGQALSGARRALDDARLLQESAPDQFLKFEHQQLAMVGAQGRQQIRLGERDDAGLHPEEPQHVEVFRGLRHGSLVGRDAEHGHVDAARRRHHGAQEALVARHVDDPGDADARQVDVRVPGFERDAASFLLGEPVGVDAGERFHQRRLAVVDVPGGPHHHSQRGGHSSTQPTPGASLARSSAGSPRITATGAAQ